MNNNSFIQCKRCLMDTSDPEIVFNHLGECNHCTFFDLNVKNFIKNDKEGMKEFNQIVNKIKIEGRNKEYDCIIGLSGGIDSSYLALKVKELDLRPLVVHVDAGWNSELAVSNIQKVVDHCGYDLFTEVIDWEVMKKLQIAYFKSGICNQDVPQDHVFFSSLYHFAIKNKIKYILSGGNFATESIFPNSWQGSAMDARNLKSIYKKYTGVKLKNYRTINLFQYYILFPFLYGMRTVRPLNYMDYNKSNALAELKRIGFKPYIGKHGESIFTKFFQDYYMPKKFGYDIRKPHLSSLILSKQISRENALKEITEIKYDSKEINDLIYYVSKKMGITKEELINFTKVPNRKFSDFPNWIFYQKIIFKINSIYKNIFGKKIKVYS